MRSAVDEGSTREERLTRGVLLDDFTRPDGRAAWGTTWRAFSDRVMGGESEARLSHERLGERDCMVVRGLLRPRDGRGFVQAALSLGTGGEPLDASDFAGFEFVARGAPGTYHLHVRELGRFMPWQYYRASFEVSERWRHLVVPFSAFEPVNMRRALDRRRLARLGFVASPPMRAAELALAEVSLALAGNDS